MFFDETDAVTRKAKIRHPRSATSKQIRKKGPQISQGDNTTILIPAPQMQRLVESPSSQAINFFLTAFAGGVYLEYLPVLLRSREGTGALEASFEAVALSYMANDRNRSDLRQIAQERYGNALSLATTALTRPETATTLDAMVSILLLALFSTLSTDSVEEAQDTWSKHILGICAVVAANPSAATFQTASGQGVLHHLISAIQVDHFQRGKPFPPQLQALYSASSHDGLEVEFWHVLGRLAELQSQADKAKVTLSYLASLHALEARLQALFELMPLNYPHAFHINEITEDYDGLKECDIPRYTFPSYRNAQTWNTLRMMRLSMMDLLVSAKTSYLMENPAIADEQANILKDSIRSAYECIEQTVVQICGTVPNDLRPSNWIEDPDSRFLWSAWGRSLIWPLAKAKDSPNCPQKLQDYIERQLTILGNLSGMRATHQEMAVLGHEKRHGLW